MTTGLFLFILWVLVFIVYPYLLHRDRMSAIEGVRLELDFIRGDRTTEFWYVSNLIQLEIHNGEMMRTYKELGLE